MIAAGIQIDERLPLIIEPSEYNRAYLETKAEKSGHLLGELASTKDIAKIQEIAKHLPHEEQ